MADNNWRTFLQEAEPELCAHWGDEQWSLFFAKLDRMGSSGYLTASAARFLARAVAEELPPRTPDTDPASRHLRKRRSTKKIHADATVHEGQGHVHDAGILHPPTSPTIDEYLVTIRQKFEALLASKHRETVSAFIEVLYRDVVFLTPSPSDAEEHGVKDDPESSG
ncbi:MAG: hypothetical protein U1D30_25570 [Planctomycetota bacterium]